MKNMKTITSYTTVNILKTASDYIDSFNGHILVCSVDDMYMGSLPYLNASIEKEYVQTELSNYLTFQIYNKFSEMIMNISYSAAGDKVCTYDLKNKKSSNQSNLFSLINEESVFQHSTVIDINFTYEEIKLLQKLIVKVYIPFSKYIAIPHLLRYNS